MTRIVDGRLGLPAVSQHHGVLTPHSYRSGPATPPPRETTQQNAPNAGDPHMTGFRGQTFDFTGDDGEWYCLISDLPSMHLNMRVTTPVPSVPEITYITGLSLVTTDTEGFDHSIVIEVTDPHSLESACPAGVSPCLADGALSVFVDGSEELLKPGTVALAPGVTVSAVNLPGECRSFGFEKYWERKKLEYAQATGRRLMANQSMADWVLGDPTATNMEECVEYVSKATAVGGEAGLFEHQSEHASFQIVMPTATIRLSHGRLHQLPMRDPTDRFDLPDHLTWQMNMAVDHHSVSQEAMGVLGETLVPILDDGGLPIMQGMGAIRGSQEDCEWKCFGTLCNRLQNRRSIAETMRSHRCFVDYTRSGRGDTTLMCVFDGLRLERVIRHGLSSTCPSRKHSFSLL